MTERPSLLEQIAAVEWAAMRCERWGLPEDLARSMAAALEAAAETLRTLEFGRGTLG